MVQERLNATLNRIPLTDLLQRDATGSPRKRIVEAYPMKGGDEVNGGPWCLECPECEVRPFDVEHTTPALTSTGPPDIIRAR
jgi:hypothetical protein